MTSIIMIDSMEGNRMTFTQTGRIRVVVIDDDLMLCNVLVDSMNRRGFLASSLTDPAEAERAVMVHGAQIVVCDVMMPGIDGLEVTRRLKARDPATQVILMSGHADQEMIDRAFKLGITDFLLKPFASLDLLFAAIDKAVAGLRHYQQQVQSAIQQEFPDEYELIYANRANVPDTGEFTAILAEVADEPDG